MNNIWSPSPSSTFLIYGAIFLGGLGFPILLEPLLLAVGLSMKAGHVGPLQGILVPTLLLCCADCVWFHLGRRHGMKSINALALRYRSLGRVMDRTRDAFASMGVSSLLFSRFVPGLTMAAPPMAGATNQPFDRFVLCDFLGISLYNALYISVGYCFAGNFDRLLDTACAFCTPLPYLSIAILTLVGAYVLSARLLLPKLRRSSTVSPINLPVSASIRTQTP